jgi:DASH complex subunit ASK1
MSSPPVAAPQLRSEIFSSPVRQQYSRPTAPRTPGVSVQIPAKGYVNEAGGRAVRDEITWESDSDQDADDVYKELGMSPPKTIQFVLAPSRLLQTPGRNLSRRSVARRTKDKTDSSIAREASKRIVEDLLMTAGAGHDTDEEDSPSMVKMQDNILDDSF